MAEKELLQIVTAEMAGKEKQDKERLITATVELMREMPLERVKCLYIHAYTWAQINGKGREERNAE